MKSLIKSFKTEITIAAICAMALIVGTVALISSVSVKPAYGAITDTKIVNIATSSTITVGPQSVTRIFTYKNFCGSRIIGTVSQPINISFGGGVNLATSSLVVTPSQFVGFPMGASTTNVLGTATYGCGSVYAFATASTTITLSEFLQ